LITFLTYAESQQQQQQQRQGVHDWPHGPDAYKLGLVIGQNVDIIAIYRSHRYYRAFPGPTAMRGCSYYMQYYTVSQNTSHFVFRCNFNKY